ncbi:MAG: tyrosine-type recombinase/integrase [Thermodesulfobacteriota bacterium]|nr:tyrosine-type recombinase/integrase [Thermodesulfobacteriota bacterium]
MLLDKIVDRGAPIAANRTLALIRKIYNFGIERDLVEYNPCTMVKAPGKEKQRDRVLTVAEIRALWTAFYDTLTPAMANIQKLRLITAQRGIDVSSMRWQDVDFETGWWTIPSEISKNTMTHRVPLSPMALDILLEQKKEDSGSIWVFPSKKKTVGHIQWFQKSFKKLFVVPVLRM